MSAWGSDTWHASHVWGGVSRRVSQAFGCSDVVINGRHVEPWWPIADCWWHCGIDIAVIVGTPLHAARAGVVTVAMRGLVKVNVDCGAHSEDDCYVHISATACRVGDRVALGQLICYSGDVNLAGGFIDGAHLHFEVQRGALNVPLTSVDPVAALTDAFTFGTGGGDDLSAEDSANIKAIYAIASGSRTGTDALDTALRGAGPYPWFKTLDLKVDLLLAKEDDEKQAALAAVNAATAQVAQAVADVKAAILAGAAQELASIKDAISAFALATPAPLSAEQSAQLALAASAAARIEKALQSA